MKFENLIRSQLLYSSKQYNTIQLKAEEQLSNATHAQLKIQLRYNLETQLYWQLYMPLITQLKNEI